MVLPSLPLRAQEPARYQDHYIAAGQLSPDIFTDDSNQNEDAGLARSFRFDGVVNILSTHSDGFSNRSSESGLQMNVQWDTRSLGAWSADAGARFHDDTGKDSSGSFGTIRLSERAMPFDGGWSADGGLGDLSAPNINLARFQTRFFLPTGPLEGGATEWRGPSGWQVIAAAGQPGLYDGIAVPAFQTLGGLVTTAGAQVSPAAQWTVGGQWLSAHDVLLFTRDPLNGNDRVSTTSGLFSTAWQSPTSRAQFNLLDSSVSGSGNALGTWVDATVLSGRITQNFGAVRLAPGLTWGNQLISNDIQGGYYQLGVQNRRWFADVGIDHAWSVSGRGLDSTFATADARYQISRDLGAGGALNVRRSADSAAWSLGSYVDVHNEWGIGRAQVNYLNSEAARGGAMTLSQGWDIRNDWHFSTSVGLERMSDSSELGTQSSSSAFNLSLSGNLDVSARVSLDGNIHWDRTLSGERASALMANVALSWQINREWTALASYYENRIGTWTAITVSSPLAPRGELSVSAVGQRAAFLTVRYQRSSGQHFAPLGGAPGSGSGRLTGTIYLDANDNGRFDASEGVAPNVTVVLDDRYSTVTDSKGRFEFAAVVTGHHVIAVVPDNLPLPWGVVGNGRVGVDVRTRDHTDVSIAVSRRTTLAGLSD
jgi:hypothetical protein